MDKTKQQEFSFASNTRNPNPANEVTAFISGNAFSVDVDAKIVAQRIVALCRKYGSF